MTTLTQLKKLAEAAKNPFDLNNCAAFQRRMTPEMVRKMVECMEQMGEVIGKCMDYQDACTCDGYAEHTTHLPSGKSMDWTQMRKALVAFDKLNKVE